MTSAETIYLLIPEIIIIATATCLCVAGAFWRLRIAASWISVAALVAAMIALCIQDNRLGMFSESVMSAAAVTGPLAVDLFGHAARWAIMVVGLVLILLSSTARPTPQRCEEVASFLFIFAGLMLAAAANDLILLFVALELVSIPTYIVLYIGRSDALGQEAASKYFFLSILSSAILLYGFTFLYGAAGSTRLDWIADALAKADLAGAATGPSQSLIPLGMLLIFAGLAFRLTAVPFHFYAPDVYQGTSNANAGILSTVPKIAGLAVLARILLTALPGWEALGWKATIVISMLTMTLGNVLALWQTNVRRLLAYSSIAHAGYLLMGVAVALAARTTDAGMVDPNVAGASGGLNGLGAAMFYLAVYMAATLGTFAALVYLRRGEQQVDRLDDLAGLNRRYPVVALAIAVFMFSLAGIPPLAGFWGKFSLLYGALTLDEFSSQNAVWLRPWFLALAVVAVLNAAIAAAYYLRVIGALYFHGPTTSEGTISRADHGLGPALAVAASLVLVIGIGLSPRLLLDGAIRAGRSLREPAAAQVANQGATGNNLSIAHNSR